MKIRNLLKFGLLFLLLAAALTACAPADKPVNTQYILTAAMRDGNFVFLGVDGDINGVINPALHAEPGEEISVMLVNSGEGTHDIVFDLGDGKSVQSGAVSKKGETTSITFTAPQKEISLNYYDSTHADLGMRGLLLVGKALPAAAPATQPATDSTAPDTRALAAQAIQKGGCSACHTIPGIDGAVGSIGPDLGQVAAAAQSRIDKGEYSGAAKTVKEYLAESIQSPDAFIAPACPSGACVKGLMPANLAQALSADELNAIVDYLAAPAAESAAPAAAMSMPAAAPAESGAVDISRDPTDLPAPIGKRGPENVRVDLETVEVIGKLADGATYHYWTFNGLVPGPMIRVRVGDTVELHLKNNAASMMTHSIDLHAVTGPGGGAVLTQTKPGEESMFTFKALNPGLFVYHCATPMVADHISNGMYGMILVEPEGGLPPVDREFYVMQGEIYTTQPFGTSGALTNDTAKLLDEKPEYFVFNGAAMALASDAHALRAKVGETVRIFFGVGGPNFTSSFHVIGEIFDRVYNQASLTTNPMTDVQTTLVPPGGATMVEFQLQVPGRYILVDHALSRLQRGLAGFLYAEGADAPDIFNGTPTAGSGH
ncbi:MAG: hypothetical protein OHK0031_02540 [Anaerolineales bacterium]